MEEINIRKIKNYWQKEKINRVNKGKKIRRIKGNLIKSKEIRTLTKKKINFRACKKYWIKINKKIGTKKIS